MSTPRLGRDCVTAREPGPPRVSVVVTNWNGRKWLSTCLGALAEQTYQNFDVLVVDNGSTDGSVEYLAETFPAVRVIANGSNLGFPAAVNQGIRASEGAYVVTLNNDTSADPGWLAALVDAAESDSRVGMCASKMLFSESPQIINSTGICIDRTAIAWDRLVGEWDDPAETEPVEVFGPCAGAALYRRQMLDEIGLFDDDFFIYLEDVDLAWRARLAGWRCLHVPAARILHHHSATMVEGSPFKNFLLGRNKVWLVVKNYPLPSGLLYLPLVLLYDLGTLPYRQLVRGDWSAVRGRWHGLHTWRRVWKKRRTSADGESASAWPAYMSPVTSLWRIHARMRCLPRSTSAA